MLPSEIHERIKNIPYMTLKSGTMMTNHIIKYDIKNVLELGFYKGVSTCYIANALRQTNGSITTIDVVCALQHTPNIHELAERCDLDNIKIYTEYQSYTWRLMHMLEDRDNFKFDMIFIDGGHTWDHTGYGFFLVDQLLEPGGWIIFDDYLWCAKNSKLPIISRFSRMQRKHYPTVYNEEVDSLLAIKKVIDLLVRPHPDYTITDIIDDTFVFAQKRK